jgi:hypothetical protein
MHMYVCMYVHVCIYIYIYIYIYLFTYCVHIMRVDTDFKLSCICCQRRLIVLSAVNLVVLNDVFSFSLCFI